MDALIKACLLMSLLLFVYYVGRKETAKRCEKYIKEVFTMRNLDGIYFRVKRDGKFQALSFTDLTDDEVDSVIGDKPAEWWKSLAIHLKYIINDMGDALGITDINGGDKND